MCQFALCFWVVQVMLTMPGLLLPQALMQKSKGRLSSCNGLTLNCLKTEVVKISRTHDPPPEDIHLTDATTHTVPQAKCLGYLLSDSLSCKPGVKENISRARKQFFALAVFLDIPTLCQQGRSLKCVSFQLALKTGSSKNLP